MLKPLFISVVVDSLFIVASIVCRGSLFGPCLLCSTKCPFQFCNHLDGEERLGCFTLIVFLICLVTVSVYGAVGWPARWQQLHVLKKLFEHAYMYHKFACYLVSLDFPRNSGFMYQLHIKCDPPPHTHTQSDRRANVYGCFLESAGEFQEVAVFLVRGGYVAIYKKNSYRALSVVEYGGSANLISSNIVSDALSKIIYESSMAETYCKIGQ